MERGSISVVAAGVIAIVLVLSVGATDVARVLAAASRAQSAADAAALAAAQELALPTGQQPSDVATRYASLNGATMVQCRCSPGALEATVRVRIEVDRLALVAGDRGVEARARAVVDLPGGVAGG